MFDAKNPVPSRQDTVGELDADFTEVARTLGSVQGVKATLQAVADLAVHTVEGCDFAGIALRKGDAVTTPVQTDPVMSVLHALQRAAGEGPGLDAIAHGGTFYADDLADDPRWPIFGPMAAEAGSRSLLAVRLSAGETVGALSLGASGPRSFGILDRAKTLILVALAGFSVSSAQLQEDHERLAGNLKAALATREVIGQAQGILIEREHVTAEEAFAILRRASQHLNIKLREVAEILVQTGERPRTTG